MKDVVTPAELEVMLNDDAAIQVFDVRLIEDRTPVTHTVPGAHWRDPNDVGKWSDEIDPKRPVVVFCVHGLRVSQAVQQELVNRRFEASILEGGIDGWQEYILKTCVDDN